MTVPIDPKTLSAERDRLKDNLRELEGDQRRLEGELKALRQKEIRAKREIEALSTLIELAEARMSDGNVASQQAPTDAG